MAFQPSNASLFFVITQPSLISLNVRPLVSSPSSSTTSATASITAVNIAKIRSKPPCAVNMKPTTVSQILEVVGKVAVGLVLAWSFTRAGKSLPVARCKVEVGLQE